MKDERTLAFINFHAILGALTELCRLDKGAAKLISGKKVAVGISVKDGPCGTLFFNGGKCTVGEGTAEADIKLPFSSCAKFNGMINGTVTPIPSRGFTKIGFLTKQFTLLTDMLTRYLRATDSDPADPDFMRISTYLTFYVVTEAISQIGNNDPIGRASASYIVDGTAKLAIGDEIGAGIAAKDHVLKTVHAMPEEFMSYMIFGDVELANQLFAGKVNSVACVGKGLIKIGGMISQVDNINRILDRVSLYLA